MTKFIIKLQKIFEIIEIFVFDKIWFVRKWIVKVVIIDEWHKVKNLTKKLKKGGIKINSIRDWVVVAIGLIAIFFIVIITVGSLLDVSLLESNDKKTYGQTYEEFFTNSEESEAEREYEDYLVQHYNEITSIDLELYDLVYRASQNPPNYYDVVVQISRKSGELKYKAEEYLRIIDDPPSKFNKTDRYYSRAMRSFQRAAILVRDIADYGDTWLADESGSEFENARNNIKKARDEFNKAIRR